MAGDLGAGRGAGPGRTSRRVRHEYRLTRKGWDLWPVLVALRQWGETYEGDPAGPVLDIRHGECGAPVRVVVGCTAERAVLTSSDVTVRPGPAARPVA